MQRRGEIGDVASFDADFDGVFDPDTEPGQAGVTIYAQSPGAIEVEVVDGGFDLAIHAAGILHEGDVQPEKSLSECNPANLARIFQVNSIGPLMVAATLFPKQSRNREFTFAALSAMVGSIAENPA